MDFLGCNPVAVLLYPLVRVPLTRVLQESHVGAGPLTQEIWLWQCYGVLDSHDVTSVESFSCTVTLVVLIGFIEEFYYY